MSTLHFAEAREFVNTNKFNDSIREVMSQMLSILESGTPQPPTPSGPPMEVGAYEVVMDSGKVYLKVKYVTNGCLYGIKADGTIFRATNVDPSLGFALDGQGRVQLAEGG